MGSLEELRVLNLAGNQIEEVLLWHTSGCGTRRAAGLTVVCYLKMGEACMNERRSGMFLCREPPDAPGLDDYPTPRYAISKACTP